MRLRQDYRKAPVIIIGGDAERLIGAGVVANALIIRSERAVTRLLV